MKIKLLLPLIFLMLASCSSKNGDKTSLHELYEQEKIRRKTELLNRLKEKFQEDKIKSERLKERDKYIELVEGIYDKDISFFDKYVLLINKIHQLSNDEREIKSILDNYYLIKGNSTIEESDIIFIGDIHTNIKIALFRSLLINYLLLKDDKFVLVYEGDLYSPDDSLIEHQSLISGIFSSIEYRRTRKYYDYKEYEMVYLKYFARLFTPYIRGQFDEMLQNMRIPILTEKRSLPGDNLECDSIKDRNSVLVQAIKDQLSKGYRVIVHFGKAHLVENAYNHHLQHLWRTPYMPDIEEQMNMSLDDFYTISNEKISRQRDDTEEIYHFVKNYRYIDIVTGSYELPEEVINR